MILPLGPLRAVRLTNQPIEPPVEPHRAFLLFGLVSTVPQGYQFSLNTLIFRPFLMG